MEHLITQLQWRLTEGKGEALYELGVNDDGTLTGLSNQDMTATLDTLRRMAEALNAEVSIAREMKLSDDKEEKCIIEALVQKRSILDDKINYTDIRMAIIGDTGVGKSTFLAHISHGIKDTGRGTARISLLRHPHEIETGNTSCIAHEMIGYTSQGELINDACQFIETWEQICEASNKVITFLDTCGNIKYMRTTISALTGYCPDYAILVVSASLGGSCITEIAREHTSLVTMLEVPLSIVITKIDQATNEQISDCIHSVQLFLSSFSGVKNHHRVPIRITSENEIDVEACANSMMEHGSAVPIFTVSNVTGANMNLIHRFFNALSASKSNSFYHLLEEPVEFQIEQVYVLVDVGIVVGGVLRQGRINIKDDEHQRTFALGPNSHGQFIKAKVVSIHRHRMPANYVHCGQTASLAIELFVNNGEEWKIKKGMVLLASTTTPESYTAFEAQIDVLYHPFEGLRQGNCGMIRTGFIRQQARIVKIAKHQHELHNEDNNESISISTGQHGYSIFQFFGDPQYLRLDSQFIFLEGPIKCLGKVTNLIKKI
ncbi:unnamed protein product [Cunninghamella echinulata]